VTRFGYTSSDTQTGSGSNVGLSNAIANRQTGSIIGGDTVTVNAAVSLMVGLTVPVTVTVPGLTPIASPGFVNDC
jgi:hypothetical protein